MMSISISHSPMVDREFFLSALLVVAIFALLALIMSTLILLQAVAVF